MSNFKTYLPICFLKVNPLDLPRSVTFLKQNFWFYFLIELLIQANMIEPSEALFEVIIETLLTFGFVGLILFLNKTTHLYVQIVTAVLFCENVVAFFIVPTITWLTVSDSIISYYFMAVLILWDFILITFILKKVIAVNLAASLTISFFYFMMTYLGAYGLTLLLF
ncbi:MAG: hypothetical protein HFP81_06330 [Methylococcales symbiont of Hymedesmia sp. n. MRB-2018]|nr:MAG: hypothetical protein HFP78_06550 [Methylococcales symbiont of Hymedesmia sp. n. MRB-2018]KAF3983629.1 MAG: hypothetical protein HFP81_06330 [Methylococcales symbiont of Hymedesmia sp. n. MRB-2018]